VKVILLLALTGIACDIPTVSEQEREFLEANLSYYYDKRTGLCFAATNLQYNSATLTEVPCNEAVMSNCDFIGYFPDKPK
jgi:hypothetical protein